MTKKRAKANPVRDGVTQSAFLYAIAQEEGNSYSVVNPDSGALGRYQVLPSNVPQWSRDCLGYSITADQFLASPRLQERIVRCKLGHLFREHGPAGAAAAWYSGDWTRYNDPTPQPGGYPSVASYSQNVYNMARRAMHLKPAKLAAARGSSSGAARVENASTAGDVKGFITDPFGWFAEKTVTPIIVTAEKLATQSLIVLAGVGIIVVGAYQAFKREDDSGGGSQQLMMPAAAPPSGTAGAGGGGGKASGGKAAAGQAADVAKVAAIA